MRSGRGRERQAPVPPGGRSGVQEPLSSGYGHHRTCLRWLGLLEHREDHCYPARGSTDSRNDVHSRDAIVGDATSSGSTANSGSTRDNQRSGRAAMRTHGPSPGARAVGTGIHSRKESDLPNTKPEGSTARPDPMALPQVRTELPGTNREDTPDMPAGTQSRLDTSDNRIKICRQAPVKRGLSFVVVK